MSDEVTLVGLVGALVSPYGPSCDIANLLQLQLYQ